MQINFQEHNKLASDSSYLVLTEIHTQTPRKDIQ